ncbi:MAG: ArgR family transcriptional regulator [Clostridia bacterium]|nr:ArgR family transcriptional regulator [Clostridia bacterium]
MKNARQEAILKIIEEQPVFTQEMLVYLLQQQGWNVTQATVSRDIKALGLRKISDGKETRYVKPSSGVAPQPTAVHANTILTSGIIDVIHAQNFVIVKCYAGMANAVCASIDNMHLHGVAGSIAGDDTIFICTLNNELAEKVKEILSSVKE